ncbi:MAG: hypothetical protein ACLRWH_12665 [Emergencia sp.]
MKRGRKSSNNTFTENGKKIWKCGKYKRLSKEDGHDVSYSIENQDAILDYLSQHPEPSGRRLSGRWPDGNRQRPRGFSKALSDIYAKKLTA